MWAYADGVRAGPNKVKCEDAAACVQSGDRLVLVLCDGAGSADHGGEGAALAARIASYHLLDGKPMDTLVEAILEAISGAAREAKADMADYACTLLGVVLDQASAVYFQLGDGGIVVSSSGVIRSPIEAHQSEFANTTWFVTMPGAAAQLRTRREESPDAVALFSDGLQYLVYDVAHRRPHVPFFTRAFDVIRCLQPGRQDKVAAWIDALLESDPVRTRTDDDTSLILAGRVIEP